MQGSELPPMFQQSCPETVWTCSIAGQSMGATGGSRPAASDGRPWGPAHARLATGGSPGQAVPSAAGQILLLRAESAGAAQPCVSSRAVSHSLTLKVESPLPLLCSLRERVFPSINPTMRRRCATSTWHAGPNCKHAGGLESQNIPASWSFKVSGPWKHRQPSHWHPPLCEAIHPHCHHVKQRLWTSASRHSICWLLAGSRWCLASATPSCQPSSPGSDSRQRTPSFPILPPPSPLPPSRQTCRSEHRLSKTITRAWQQMWEVKLCLATPRPPKPARCSPTRA